METEIKAVVSQRGLRLLRLGLHSKSCLPARRVVWSATSVASRRRPSASVRTCFAATEQKRAKLAKIDSSPVRATMCRKRLPDAGHRPDEKHKSPEFSVGVNKRISIHQESSSSVPPLRHLAGSRPADRGAHTESTRS